MTTTYLAVALTSIVALILIGVYLLRPQKKNKITIPLKDLSTIWTPFNNTHEDIEIIMETDPFESLFSDNEDSEQEATPEKSAKIKKEKSIEEKKPKTESTNISPEEQAKEKKKVTEQEYSGKEKDITDITLGAFKRFWEECVKPYNKNFKQQDVMDVVKELISMLEKYGHCPSVVTDKKDTEAVDLISVKDNLVQVTLKDHTYAVARHLVEAVKKSYVDPEDHIPKAVVSALAHDIGKIPELRLTTAYNTYEHHLISAHKLMEMFAGKDIFWAKQAVNAVENHHAYSKDEFAILLKKADQETRQLELIKHTKKLEIIPFEKWFIIGDFYNEIEPHINYIQAYKKWHAFTFKGIIYCKPDFLYDTAKKLCRNAKVLDLSFVYESEKESVLRKVISVLRQSELVPDFLNQNYYARKFEIKTQMGKNNMILTPIKPVSSYDLNAIESRKMGYLEIIQRVVPVGKC